MNNDADDFNVNKRVPRSFRLSKMALIALVISATCTSGVWADTYYRWVDEEGITHYTSTPPRGIPSERVTSSTGTGTAPEVAPDDESANEEDAVAAEAPGEAAGAARDPERCAVARKRLKVLETNQRIRMKAESGEYQYLTQDQIQEELAASRAAIKESC